MIVKLSTNPVGRLIYGNNISVKRDWDQEEAVTDENDVEVKESIDEVEIPRFGAIQVGSVRCEDVVFYDVEGGERGLSVVLEDNKGILTQPSASQTPLEPTAFSFYIYDSTMAELF